MNNNDKNENDIGEPGACSIGDGLKMNSTLTFFIWDWGVNDKYDEIWWYLYELINNNERNGNNIGDSGGCSIGEVLKMNSTLTRLYLGVRS